SHKDRSSLAAANRRAWGLKTHSVSRSVSKCCCSGRPVVGFHWRSCPCSSIDQRVPSAANARASRSPSAWNRASPKTWVMGNRETGVTGLPSEEGGIVCEVIKYLKVYSCRKGQPHPFDRPAFPTLGLVWILPKCTPIF